MHGNELEGMEATTGDRERWLGLVVVKVGAVSPHLHPRRGAIVSPAAGAPLPLFGMLSNRNGKQEVSHTEDPVLLFVPFASAFLSVQLTFLKGGISFAPCIRLHALLSFMCFVCLTVCSDAPKPGSKGERTGIGKEGSPPLPSS